MTNMLSPAEPQLRDAQSTETDYRRVDLLRYWVALKRRKGTLAAFAVAGLLAGTVTAFTIQPRYDAIVRFLPPPPKQAAPLSLIATNNQGDHYLGLVGSRTVADDVIEHLHLKEYFHAKNATEARERLSEISTIVVDKDQFVTVKVRAKEPETAANIANEYVNALYRLDHSLAMVESEHRRDFFEGPLELEKNRLADAEEALKRGQQKTGMVSPDAQVRLGVSAIAELKQEITTREAQLASLRTGGTEQNPQVIQLKSQIASLQNEVARLQSQNGGSGVNGSKAEMPQLTMEVEREAREVKYHETLFEILSRQYENARLEDAYTPAIELVDPAVRPDQKAWPPRKLFMLIGLVIGGLMGMIYVMISVTRQPAPWSEVPLPSEAEDRTPVSRS